MYLLLKQIIKMYLQSYTMIKQNFNRIDIYCIFKNFTTFFLKLESLLFTYLNTYN